MNIIDTNTIIYLVKNNIILDDVYFTAPDVSIEVELVGIHSGLGRVRESIIDIASTKWFDESIYLSRYQSMLNAHGGRSFYNMTGFGDISTLAALHMLKDIQESQPVGQGRLFDAFERITMFTDDQPLRQKVIKEMGDYLDLRGSKDIASGR